MGTGGRGPWAAVTLFLAPALAPGRVQPLRMVSSSAPICRWKMNGTEMKLVPGSRHQLVGGNLVIMNPTKAQDAGVYQCLASNPVGTIVSREAVLRFGCETRGGCQDAPGEGNRELGKVSRKGR